MRLGFEVTPYPVAFSLTYVNGNAMFRVYVDISVKLLAHHIFSALLMHSNRAMTNDREAECTEIAKRI